MTVADFPLPAAKAIDIIRQQVAAGTCLMPERFADGDWPHVVYRRQAQRCLESGKIVDGPRINEHGHYHYRMHRLGAGQDIYLMVVLYKGADDWVVRVVGAETHE